MSVRSAAIHFGNSLKAQMVTRGILNKAKLRVAPGERRSVRAGRAARRGQDAGVFLQGQSCPNNTSSLAVG